MRTSFPAPGLAPSGMVVVDDWENSSVDERDRSGLDRSEDSSRREIGSSDVKVRERKRVEKAGTGVSLSSC